MCIEFRNVSDRVVVLTKQNKDFLIKEKIYPLDRIREYQNGIPLDGWREKMDSRLRGNDKMKDGYDNGELVVLTPIRLAPEKNVDLILRIVYLRSSGRCRMLFF